MDVGLLGLGRGADSTESCSTYRRVKDFFPVCMCLYLPGPFFSFGLDLKRSIKA